MVHPIINVLVLADSGCTRVHPYKLKANYIKYD